MVQLARHTGPAMPRERHGPQRLNRQHHLSNDLVLLARPSLSPWHDLVNQRPISFTSAGTAPSLLGQTTGDRAWRFDGINDKLQIAGLSNDIWCNTDAKFSVTVEASTLTGQPNRYDNAILAGVYGHDASFNVSQCWAVWAGLGKITFAVYDDATLNAWVQWETTSTYTGRRTINVVYDNTPAQDSAARCRIYIDGAEVSRTYNTGGTVISLRRNSEPLTIGNNSQNADPTDYYNYLGDISRVLIHANALTPAQVWQLYAAQSRQRMLRFVGSNRNFIASEPASSLLFGRRPSIGRAGHRSLMSC